MFEASGVGFLVGGTFLNRGHFDLIYHLLAAVTALSFLARRELAGAGESAPELALTGPPRVVPAGRPWRAVVAGQGPPVMRRLLPRWGR
jgi:hypothetical protein